MGPQIGIIVHWLIANLLAMVRMAALKIWYMGFGINAISKFFGFYIEPSANIKV